jgi:hypothetical protein
VRQISVWEESAQVVLLQSSEIVWSFPLDWFEILDMFVHKLLFL